MSDQSLSIQSAKKRCLSELLDTCVRRPKDEVGPPHKKKLRSKLVDLFNRVSMAATQEECMKVYLRVKPFTEEEDSTQKFLKVIQEEKSVIALAPESSHAHKSSTRGVGKSSLKFTFSEIFGEAIQQAEFFNSTMLDMTKQSIGGQNSLVFSYGVTSSGKTYTIQGKPQDAGILPRSLDVLFNSIQGKQISNPRLKPEMFNDVVKLSPDEVQAEQKIKRQTLKMCGVDDPTMMSLMGEERESVLSDTVLSSSSGMDELLADVVNRDREKLTVDVEENMRFGVWVSFAEVYNEGVYDLLVPVPTKKGARRSTLRICDDRNGNPYIKGLKEIHVESADVAYRLLTIGQRNLMTACTRLNHCSSRSHSIFNIKIVRVVDKDEPHLAYVSTLSLCDLAGSERYSKTQATGERLKEAGNINTSLMTLGRCIETLRHNQLHRDRQRLVPFRDSKLTRILQNFFNGFGKAAMIVNVSQAASMYDDTLHVFKFSAIAQQVKYEKAPEEKRPYGDKAAISARQRQTISWETEASRKLLSEAQNLPVPDEDLSDEDMVESDSFSGADDMRTYIKSLETRNERLVELLAEEMNNAAANEARIRKEVIDNMQKQMVVIEENYSTMLKDAKDAMEDVEELADERVKGIMEVYERRLERIQKKVDEDDEWVSSMLYHQEKMKVEERDAKILELEKKLKEIEARPVNDSVDLGNSVLVETLTHKLKEATDEVASKDGEIEELKLLVEEAGETYTNHVTEIKDLKETLRKQQKASQQKIADLEQLVSDAKADSDKALKSVAEKEEELLTLKEEMASKLRSKDTTISSLDEECKQLQEEIERLQDQMSQMGDPSHLRCDLDVSAMSSASDRSARVKRSTGVTEDGRKRESKLKLGKENICETEQSNRKLMEEMAALKAELDNKHGQWETLKATHCSTLKEMEAVIREKESVERDSEEAAGKLKEMECSVKQLQQQNGELMGEKEWLEDQMRNTAEKINAMEINVKELQEQTEELTGLKKSAEKDLEQATMRIKEIECSVNQLKEERDGLVGEKGSLEKANAELMVKLQIVEDKCESPEEHVGPTSEISHMVKILEEKTPVQTPIKLADQENKDGNDDDDDEIVFNVKSSPTAISKTPFKPALTKTPSKLTPTSSCDDLALKLKDAELANVALRSKLKHEEEDFFKREQALIHGYTAEVDSLKHELAKYKTKTDCSKPQRGKKRALMDISSCSSVSESYCEGVEEKASGVSRLDNVEENPDKTQGMAVLSSEVCFLQEQLTSLRSALLHAERKQISDGKSVKQEVESSTKAARYSVDILAGPRPSLTNSVLLFEKDEFAVRIEELNSRGLQLEAQVRTLTGQLEQEKKVANEAHLKHQCELEAKAADSRLDLQQASQRMQALTEELQGAHKSMDEFREIREKLETDLAGKDMTVTQLRESVEKATSLKAEAESELHQSGLRVQALTSELEDLSQRQAGLLQERDAALSDLKQLNIRLNSMETQLDTVRTQNSVCEKEVLEKTEQLKALEEQLSSDCRSKADALSSVEQHLTQMSSQLDEKSKELERICSLRQEEAAEVSQKLILLERQKKAAERRAAEANSREQEMQLRLQGHEAHIEEADKLRAELQQASVRLREQEDLAAHLRKDVATLTEEVKQLRESELAVVPSKRNLEDLKTRLADVEETLEKEREAKQRACFNEEQLLEKVEELKVELLESEKTMNQQEDDLTKQDQEIKDLKTELENSNLKRDKLDKALTCKDLELAHLNKQISTAAQEAKGLDEVRMQNCRLQEEVKDVRSQNGRFEEEANNVRSENCQLQEELREIKSQNCRLEEAAKDVRSQNHQFEEEAKNFKSENCQLHRDLKDIRLQNSRLEEEVKDIRLQNSRLEEEVKDMRSQNCQLQNDAKDVRSQDCQLQKEAKKAKEDLTKTQQDLENVESRLQDMTENKKAVEKELLKQENINKRNKEEMEHWKAERDLCVKRLEQCISKMSQERDQLSEEVEKLKKKNADLAQETSNITLRKDALIAELKKLNNTLSIQLADSQGLSPPPKMATPESAFPARHKFEEDLDTTGHIEIDVTPLAAKRGKKRQASSLALAMASSSVDPEIQSTPEPRCLKAIKEEAESPAATPGRSPRVRVAELASEVIATLSPLTRSSAKRQTTHKKEKKSSMPPPFETAAFGVPASDDADESSGLSTRRSSRLRKQKSKHSLV